MINIGSYMRNYLLTLIAISVILSNCAQKETKMDIEKVKESVWNTVLAHNNAWSAMEDLDEQARYIHEEIIFVAPPYRTPVRGKKEYRKSYQEWIDHATVHYFKEVDHEITILGDGTLALVIFKIDMSFDYDDQKIDRWQGIDMMTLVFENEKWLITSDMYAKKVDQDNEIID
ncbi:YybH family protein [Bacteroidota bacterium]